MPAELGKLTALTRLELVRCGQGRPLSFIHSSLVCLFELGRLLRSSALLPHLLVCLFASRSDYRCCSHPLPPELGRLSRLRLLNLEGSDLFETPNNLA